MLKKMRNFIGTVVLIILCFVIQNTISVEVHGVFVTPNILIIFTSLFAFMRGQKDGLLIGFLSGLLVDIFAEDIIGLNALIYMYVGFFSGIFHRIFYKDMVVIPLGIVFASDFIYNFFYYVSRFLVRNRLDFSYYMMKIILPEMIFTTFLALLVHRLLYWIHAKWLVKEQRSTLNFD